MTTAKLNLNGNDYEFSVVTGSEGEVGIDIKSLRSASGAITLDPGYGNTGSCESAITFIDGEEGILRYRGYPIEELAEQSTFEEVMHLLIYGHLPNASELQSFEGKLQEQAHVHEDVKQLIDGFPANAHPMAVINALVAALPGFESDASDDEQDIIRLIARVKTLAAWAYRRSAGLPYVASAPGLSYSADFMHMMFGSQGAKPSVSPEVESAINKLLILHADHEQNCSTSTVRMVGSSGATLYAAIAAGIGALSGPLHGGANQAVIEMLDMIDKDGGDHDKYMAMAKDKSSGFRLMGFGHRVYKNFDPRARILKRSADSVLEALGVNDPMLNIAKQLEQVALSDSHFVDRRLYPNVDFYSGIIYRALNIPTEMFTVMFVLGRVPGWIAHWREMRLDPTTRIHRPRQIYTGSTKRSVERLSER
ncbi:MAG: citrate synthase [Bradymonadaceae bacterium]|nr:citrate synthase [Lujinxingiaceae bacterium]